MTIDKDIVICRILNTALLLLTLFLAQSAEAFQIVAHKSVSVESLKVSQLGRIYSMRQLRWADRQAIVVYVLPSKHPLHQKFSKNLLSIFPYKLDLIWNKLIFSGLGVAPKVVNAQRELLQAVSSTPGAIGYLEILDKEEQVNVIELSL